MRILVTGGTGFVGSNIVRKLISEGHEVLITGSDAECPVEKGVVKYLQPSFIGIDWKSIGKLDVVFHEAAINDTTLNDENEMLRANLDSSRSLFEFAAQNGCKKIIYASSTAVYGNANVPFVENGKIEPLNVYGESKKRLDEYASMFAVNHPEIVVVGLRYCNVYGPGENHKGKRASMIYQLARQMMNGNPKLFKMGEQKRDWIYVDDVVYANMCAMNSAKSCIVNCGSGSATSFNEIVEILNETLGVSRNVEYIDNPFSSKYQSFTYCDMTYAKEMIGFEPRYDIKRGIKSFFESGYLTRN